MADRHVTGVDQLAAELRYLPVRPVARGVRVHAAADPLGRRLVDRRGVALVRECQRGVEAGDTASDDRDL